MILVWYNSNCRILRNVILTRLQGEGPRSILYPVLRLRYLRAARKDADFTVKTTRAGRWERAGGMKEIESSREAAEHASFM